jgi:hypothetical protein
MESLANSFERFTEVKNGVNFNTTILSMQALAVCAVRLRDNESKHQVIVSNY